MDVNLRRVKRRLRFVMLVFIPCVVPTLLGLLLVKVMDKTNFLLDFCWPSDPEQPQQICNISDADNLNFIGILGLDFDICNLKLKRMNVVFTFHLTVAIFRAAVFWPGGVLESPGFSFLQVACPWYLLPLFNSVLLKFGDKAVVHMFHSSVYFWVTTVIEEVLALFLWKKGMELALIGANQPRRPGFGDVPFGLAMQGGGNVVFGFARRRGVRNIIPFGFARLGGHFPPRPSSFIRQRRRG